MSNARKPRAFKMEGATPKPTKAAKTKTRAKTARKPRAVPASPKLEYATTDENFFAQQELDASAPPPIEPARKRGWRLGTIAFAAFSFLIAASMGLWIENLVAELLAQNTWLGWAGIAAAAIFTLAVLVFVAREILAMRKLRIVSGLREDIAQAIEHTNANDISLLTGKLESHFSDNPKTAHGRAVLAENKTEVLDAKDRYLLTERELLAGLDEEAVDRVMASAKRVSVVTAVSPRALIDVGYVLYENIRLIRHLCELYGGRTGMIGTFALARRVVAHLAVTGTIALGDGIVQQLMGHGLASKLSARLGEGVINGIMTARIGLSAIDVCRPAPFIAQPKPKLGSFVSSLTKFSSKSTEAKAQMQSE